MVVIYLSDKERDIILSLLRREVATLNDDGGACRTLVKVFERTQELELD